MRMWLWSLVVAGCTPKQIEQPVVPDQAEASPPGEVDPMAAALQAQADAFAAHGQGDYATFLAKTQESLALDPDNIANQYNLACGYALTGQREPALQALRDLMEQGIAFGASQDSDFATLHDDPEFLRLTEQMAQLFPTVSHGERAFDLGDDLGLAPEGIAYDPVTQRFFVGSTRQGTVFSVAPDKQRAQARAMPEQQPATAGASPDSAVVSWARLAVGDVPVSTLGLEVDAQRNRLWAVGTAFAFHRDFQPDHQGTTAVFGLDLATGEIEEVHSAQTPGPFGFNDVTVGPDGSLYLSGPGVWVLRPGSDTPEPLGEQPAVRNSNGITMGADGFLYVAADRRNITRIDLTTLQREWLTLPEGVNLRSFDGLYYLGDALVGVQLGLGKWRVVRADLDADGTTVTGIEVLEQSNPEILGATTGAVVQRDLVVITRAPLPAGTDAEPHGPAPGQAVAWRIPIRP